LSIDEYIGLTLDGKYKLEELLGKGGMGAVYKGKHALIGKTVAVKFLHAEFSGNEEVVKRFYREAQAAAAIGHDNIIDVLDVGVSPNGEPYLVMEFLEGENLGAMLARTGPVDIGTACAVLEPVLLALNMAHQKGIVHRDLKPDNIFMVHREGAPPKVKLIDFGISKFAENLQGEKLTQTGSVMGTPAYMSPEQARGDSNLDHRADVYSMGVILYEMLTGKLPFVGDNFTAMIINILTTDPIPPVEAYSNFPQVAEEMLLRSLVKNPVGRFQSALEFLEAAKGLPDYRERQEKLTQVAAGITKKTFAAGNLGTSISSDSGTSVASDVLAEVMGATPTGWAGTKPGSKKKRAMLLPMALGVLLVLVGAAVFLLLQRDNSTRPAIVPAAPVAPPAVPLPAPKPDNVELTIIGVPSTGKIFFNNKEVPGNPFKVQKGQSEVLLRVEAVGYMTHSQSVVPSAEQNIHVALSPIPNAPEADKAPQHAEEKKDRRSSKRRSRREKKTEPKEALTFELKPSPIEEKPAPPPAKKTPTVKITKTAPEEKKKTMVKGARGTKMQTSFE
jgi:serine/threonine protein kinase